MTKSWSKSREGDLCSTFYDHWLSYILTYKSQNLWPNLDQKVGRATYARVMTRQARWGLTSLPPLWRPTGQLRRLHTQLTALWRVDDGCLPSLLQSIDGICSLFSAVVGQSLWRRESHSPSLLSANTPNGCCWTLDRDNRPPVRFAPLPNVASSTSPQKPPTTYTWVDDFRPDKDSLLGGDLYARATYMRVYTVIIC